MNYQILKKGGWHFSNLKTPKDLIKKITSFCHGELNKSEFINEKLIEKKIDNLEDIFDRNIEYKKILIDNSFPDFLIKNQHIYKNWIL